MRISTIVLSAVCAVTGFFSPGTAQAHPDDLTYNGKIIRILQAHCITCHRVGGVAPFSMETYAQTRPYSSAMSYFVANRTMPPWNASHEQGFPAGQGFEAGRSLSQETIDTLVAWDNAGGPEGDPTDAPPPMVFSEWHLGQPDLILEMPVDYTVPANGPDIYRCFVLPTRLTQDRTVIGLEVNPGDDSVAHHAIIFPDNFNQGPGNDAAEGSSTDGYTCFGGPNVLTTTIVGGWAPGSYIQPFHERIGTVVRRNSNLILQMHYHPTTTTKTDRTRIGLKFATLPNTLALMTGGSYKSNFTIPPNVYDHTMTDSVTVLNDSYIITTFPHMHQFGKTMKAQIRFPDGSIMPLIDIQKWDFNWQNYYVYAQPIRVPRNSVIEVSATYDNPTNNPIYEGEATTDEMMLLGIGTTLAAQGTPPSRDIISPKLIGSEVSHNGNLTSVNLAFDEPIKAPRIPSDLDVRSVVGRVDPVGFNVSGSGLYMQFANLYGIEYTLTLRGFAGITDLNGNFFDGNENGTGGELADNRQLVFTGPPGAPTPAPTPLPVDPNALRQYLLGNMSAPDGMDVNQDGAVDVADLLLASLP